MIDRSPVRFLNGNENLLNIVRTTPDAYISRVKAIRSDHSKHEIYF